jgi:hypothetical protein
MESICFRERWNGAYLYCEDRTMKHDKKEVPASYYTKLAEHAEKRAEYHRGETRDEYLRWAKYWRTCAEKRKEKQ